MQYDEIFNKPNPTDLDRVQAEQAMLHLVTCYYRMLEKNDPQAEQLREAWPFVATAKIHDLAYPCPEQIRKAKEKP